MILLLLVVFWITIVGANYPSEFLFEVFGNIGEKLYQLFENKSSKQTKFENIIETEMDNIALQQQSNTVNMLLEKKLSKMQQIPYLKFLRPHLH